MKKNRMMRLAAVLLIAVLLTTSVISGTFAKYTTSASSDDTARVAYWGFQSFNSMDITGLFDKAYDNVKSFDEVDVIAPGTTNSKTFTFAWDESVKDGGNAIGVTGPEVAYDFTVSVDGSTCDPEIANNANIQWKLDNGAWGDWGTLLANIKALSGDPSGTKQYAPGQLPSAFTATDDVHTIAWQWVFYTDNAADVVDTALGNADELNNVTIKITINATQVD